MEGQTPDFPHSFMPRPASFSVCSMTLFVFKSPGLRKPQWGVTGLGGCQWGETPSFASFSPPPSPLPWALWTPLPTPFILGLLRFGVLQPLPVTCKELVPGVQGRKQNIPPCSWAQCLKFHHHCLSLRL